MLKNTWKNSVTKNNLWFYNFRRKREIKMNTTLLIMAAGIEGLRP